MSLVINTHTPNQDSFFKSYTQLFHSYYDHKKDKHYHYITPEFGKYTRIIGENTILEGFNLSGVTYTNTSVQLTVGHGRLIINDTYIEIHSSNDVVFDQANAFDDSGFFVLSASFINERTLRSNKLRYHLTYFDEHNNSFNQFNHERDKVILGVFDFTKSGGYVNSFTLNDFDVDTIITLDGVNYPVRNNITAVIRTLIDGGIAGVSLDDLPEDSYLGGSEDGELLVAVDNAGAISVLQL